MANKEPDYGLLKRDVYKNASFSNLHSQAPEELKALVKKFKSMTKEAFYENKLNIYLYGSYRVGKTFILHCIAKHIIEKFGEKSIYFVRVPDLYKYFMKNTPYRDNGTMIKFLLGRRVLIIDDLGQEYRANSGFAETMVEDFIRKRFNKGYITYIGSNANIDTLEKTYGESFSALISGEYVCIEIEDDVNISKILLEEKLKSL